MLVKCYKALWALFILAIIGTCVVSGPSYLAFSVFGFIAFGMIFLGMIIVMPFALLHEADTDPAVASTDRSVKPQTAPGFDAKWLHGSVPAR